MRLNAFASLSVLALTLAACATTSDPGMGDVAPPPPPPPPSAEASTGIVYSCDNGTKFNIYFSENAATVTLSDGTKLILPQQVAASGIWYSSGRHDFRGKGRNATWTVGKMVPTQCVTD
ncbi:MliC family protein [Asticcacaulis sp. BYS171W]|uniref:MliC family protein n=1 Tax=Asticcacaulis aquaticus TaxID=2984212 RepID=A0ABT5HTC5_9CAUL|nr:MliC family protein [Asticcacaulis aquaticus]MDC7683197.1 MliC family protein [Asticcacaulis aquaticus]